MTDERLVAAAQATARVRRQFNLILADCGRTEQSDAMEPVLMAMEEMLAEIDRLRADLEFEVKNHGDLLVETDRLRDELGMSLAEREGLTGAER